ncbi:hypothetical protein AMATHDRAFT_63940 [Amanita thiersii Skay4041]|uniref:Uncharacterized protein n=1 Tax=Amanita thiersii Skay4041 TaxID=703135 RepID=A0A2A9NG34_9AGAR|nr:hypothetical protein AMATHDRAFT_63940 [Amanita thiersii Skay4041]
MIVDGRTLRSSSHFFFLGPFLLLSGAAVIEYGIDIYPVGYRPVHICVYTCVMEQDCQTILRTASCCNGYCRALINGIK